MRRVATTAFALVLLAASTVATTGINFSVCGKETADPSSDWSLSVTFDSAGDCNSFSQGMGVSATQGSVFGFPACGSRTYCFNGNSTAQFAVSPDVMLANDPDVNPGSSGYTINGMSWSSYTPAAKPPVMHVRGVFGDKQSCTDYEGDYAYWSGVTPSMVTLGTQGTCTTKQNSMRSQTCGAGEYRNFDVSGDCGSIIFPYSVHVRAIVYDPPAADSPFSPITPAPATPTAAPVTTATPTTTNATTATAAPSTTAAPISKPEGVSSTSSSGGAAAAVGINLATCGQHAADAGSDWTLSITFESEDQCNGFMEGMGLATTQGSVRGYSACSVRTVCFNGAADAQFSVFHDQSLPTFPTTRTKDVSFTVTSILWSSLHEGQAPPVMRIRGIYGNTQACTNHEGNYCYWSGLETTDANLGTQGTCLTSTTLNNCQVCGSASTARDFDVFGDCGSLTTTYPFYFRAIVYAPGAITPTPVPTQ